jgi:hypothetical protein
LIDFSPSSSGIPAHEPMTLDAAFSIQPKLGAGAYLNLVLEDRDVTNQSGMSFLGRLAVGAEFSFRDQFFLRAGWGSGYPSLGLGLTRKSGGDLGSLAQCRGRVRVSQCARYALSFAVPIEVFLKGIKNGLQSNGSRQ